MSHDRFVKKSIIYDRRTGAMSRICTGDKDRYYAAFAKCGHVDLNYFMPICFPIMATDAESAAELTKLIPRVKRDRNDFLLGLLEISEREYYFISCCNDYDPYLTKPDVDESWDMVQKRRIMEPEIVRTIANDEDFHTTRQGYKIRTSIPSSVKTADDYDETQSLQRAFAPRKNGNDYIYLKNVNAREVLDAYIHEMAYINGIIKKNNPPLFFYYQIFGKSNRLGLEYTNGELLRRDGNRVYKVPLTEDQKNYIETSPFIREQEPEDPRPVWERYDDDGVEHKPRPSAIDKFNRRMEKHNEAKNVVKSEPEEPQRG